MINQRDIRTSKESGECCNFMFLTIWFLQVMKGPNKARQMCSCCGFVFRSSGIKYIDQGGEVVLVESFSSTLLEHLLDGILQCEMGA